MATHPGLALTFVAMGGALGALASPARADVDLELHPGARVLGSIAPGDAHELYYVRAPRGATLEVVLRGVKSAGRGPAEGLTTVVSGPNVTPLPPVRERRGRATYAADVTGLYTVRVLPGRVGGDYKLRVRVRVPRRQPFRGTFAADPLTFVFPAAAGSTAKFVVRPRRGSGARPQLDRLRLGFTEVARFGPAAIGGSRVHRVREVPISETAEYQLVVTDPGGPGGAITGVVVTKPPRYARADIDVEVRDPPEREAVYGRLVGAVGGIVTVPDAGRFGVAGVAGASVQVPSSAYPQARSVRIDRGDPIELPGGEFAPAGSSVRIAAPAPEGGAAVTLQLPYDGQLDLARSGFTVFRRSADGLLAALPPEAVQLDSGAGMVSIATDDPGGTYRVFAPPTEPAKVVGDLDGDGAAELIVRSPDAGSGDGAVFGFHVGLNGATRFTGAADFTLELDGAGSRQASFGQRSATGDFDGDGQDDLVVTSFLFDVTRGAATLYSSTPDFGGSRLTARITFMGQEFEELGDDVALADVNGDGKADLIVSAVLGGPDAEGVVYVFLGRTFPAGPLVLTTNEADHVLRGENNDDWFGWSVVADDLTGDGVADIAVSTYPAEDVREKVYIFSGGPGLGAEVDAQDADIRLTGAGRGDFFGSDLAAGDLTGDGVADLVVGAAAFDATPGGAGSNHGALYVFAGGPELTSGGAGSSIQRIDGGVDELTLGLSIQVGDVSGDLVADLIAGASIVDEEFIDFDPGNVFVFLGGAGLAPRSTGDADVTIVGDVDGDAFQIVEPPVDVNGDGVRDLIVAAPLEEIGGPAAGTCSVFFGGSTLLLATTATDADVRVIGSAGQALGGFPDF